MTPSARNAATAVAEQLEAGARRPALPARDREHAALAEVCIGLAQRFDGIEETVCRCLHAGARTGQGICGREFNQVESFAGRAQIAARFGNHDAHTRIRIQVPGKIGKRLARQRHALRIQIDRHNGARTELQCLQHVAAAARAEHEHARRRQQRERQR
jgi:hypothetical protein